MYVLAPVVGSSDEVRCRSDWGYSSTTIPLLFCRCIMTRKSPLKKKERARLAVSTCKLIQDNLTVSIFFWLSAKKEISIFSKMLNCFNQVIVHHDDGCTGRTVMTPKLSLVVPDRAEWALGLKLKLNTDIRHGPDHLSGCLLFSIKQWHPRSVKRQMKQSLCPQYSWRGQWCMMKTTQWHMSGSRFEVSAC